MKFDIEIVCTQEIIMGYNIFIFFSKKGGPRGKTRFPPPPSWAFLFLKIFRGIYRIFLIQSYVFLFFFEKANYTILILVKVHFGGLRAPYLQSP